MWWGSSLKAGTYSVLGLNERVVNSNDIDVIMLNAVDSCQPG